MCIGELISSQYFADRGFGYMQIVKIASRENIVLENTTGEVCAIYSTTTRFDNLIR
jgi:hypothetical protein